MALFIEDDTTSVWLKDVMGGVAGGGCPRIRDSGVFLRRYVPNVGTFQM